MVIILINGEKLDTFFLTQETNRDYHITIILLP